MDLAFSFVGFIIFAALVFDFINGFHDAANSIATVVSTRVLSPQGRGDVGRVLQLPGPVHLRARTWRKTHRQGHHRRSNR
jgi:hypothetical protein